MPRTAIVADPAFSPRYVVRGTLVTIVANGTAVPGVGDVVSSASNPVMNEKVARPWKLAGIDPADVAVGERDPGRLTDIICAMASTFGAVKAADRSTVEPLRHEQMNTPVFHSDRRCTAIVIDVAAVNVLHPADGHGRGPDP